MVKRALKVFSRWNFFSHITEDDIKLMAKRWADNMRICSCDMCRSVKYRDERQNQKNNWEIV